MQQAFLDAIAKAGIYPTHSLIFDGRLRRYRVSGDKKGRKNGWYRYCQVTNDFAWGVFGCNKRGVNERWNSKDTKSITAYERKEKKRQERDIRNADEILAAKAAIKAANIWGRLPAADRTHPYLVKKGISARGIRRHNNALVIPVWIDNCIVSLQFIYPDGGKRFLTGGKIQGGNYWIGEETDVIYLVEGYATGASIYEAVGNQVVICFNANNMPIVAKMLRERMPDKCIVIAADNDQWTKGNPGFSKAQEAQKLIDAEIKIPPFSYEDKAMPTDWNDYHLRFSLKALADEMLIKKQIEPASIANIPTEHQWRQELIDGKCELPGFKHFDPKSKQNAFLFLKHHDHFKDMVIYNIFTDEMLVIRQPPWQSSTAFTARSLQDTDAFAATKELEKFGFRVREPDVYSSLRLIADENSINPLRDYFHQLKWDGTHRLDSWLSNYLGCDKQPKEYLRAIGAKWLMGAVKRVFDPGCKFDSVLVLEGKQGIKKTTVFRTLATFGEDSYFLEFSGSISGKDALMQMQGKLIVEMSELATLRKSNVEEMKGFISRQVDEYRPPYGKHVVKRPRFFVIGATTNNVREDGYLVDQTGNRRYWPAECGNIDLEALERDKEQLWAEAVARYQEGEIIWLEEMETELAEQEQNARKPEGAWEEILAVFVKAKDEITTDEAATHLDFSSKEVNNSVRKEIKRCLKNLGWYETKRSGEDRSRVWRKSPAATF